MRVMKCADLASAHEAAVLRLLDLDRIRVIGTQDDELTFEGDGICLEVPNPAVGNVRSSIAPQGDRFYEEYARCLILGYKVGQGFDYDYHSRLFEYDVLVPNGYAGGGNCTAVNQIGQMIEKLKNHGTSRRAVAVTWKPGEDGVTDADVPCLQLVECMIRDGKLEMSVVFRSNDMLSALGSNMYALASLQAQMAMALKVGVGKYQHVSISDHMYPIRDMNYLLPFMEKKGVTEEQVRHRAAQRDA